MTVEACTCWATTDRHERGYCPVHGDGSIRPSLPEDDKALGAVELVDALQGVFARGSDWQKSGTSTYAAARDSAVAEAIRAMKGITDATD